MQLKNSVKNTNLEIQLRNTVETVEKYTNAAECMQSTFYHGALLAFTEE